MHFYLTFTALELKKMRERQKLQKQQKEQQLKIEREMRTQQIMEVHIQIYFVTI